MDFFSLKGKSVIITGGTGVLGTLMTKGVAEAGASVAILGRRKEVAEKLAAEITSSGGKAIAIVADVLNREQLVSARDQVRKAFGSIDVLINAAGGKSNLNLKETEAKFVELVKTLF